MSSHSYQDDEPADNSKGFGRILALALFLIALALSIAATSCMTEKRALKKMGGIAARQPDAALRFCAGQFPPTVETITNTEYLPGETKYLPGRLLTVDCDSARAAMGGAQTGTGKSTRVLVNVPCPPSSTRVDSFIKTITVTKTNTAKEQLLTQENTDLKADNTRLKKGKKTATIAASALGVLLVAGFVLRLKKIV